MKSRRAEVNLVRIGGLACAARIALVLALCAAPLPARDAPVGSGGERTRLPPADLLSHSGSDHYWISQVLPRTASTGRPGAVEPLRTAVRSRQASTDRGWQRVIVVQGRVIDLGHRGDNAAILIDDGSWLLAWPNGSSTGPSLPDGAMMTALGADDVSLWAVGVRAPGDSTEQPAPTGAPAATPGLEAATPAAGARLYVFGEAGWQPRGTLPQGLPGDAPISLAVMGGKPMLAVLVGPRRLAFARVDSDDNWTDVEYVEVDFDIRQFELFDQAPSPTLWIAPPTGAGQLRIRRGGQWTAPIALDAGSALAGPALARTAEYFAGSVRLTWWDGKQLRERPFSLDGQPVGEAAVLGRTPPVAPQPIGSGTLVLLGVLGALLALNILRADDEEDLDLAGRKVRLAPLPLRLVAGLIDLAPIPLVMLWQLLPLLSRDGADSAEVSEAMQSQSFAIWTGGSIVLYLLHTTITELLTGRTIGKFACGLRTIAMDGPPRPGAILLRNAFRIIDLVPALPLALLILFSPLRQRLGDVVAGTLVIRDRPAPVAAPEEGADTRPPAE